MADETLREDEAGVRFDGGATIREGVGFANAADETVRESDYFAGAMDLEGSVNRYETGANGITRRETGATVFEGGAGGFLEQGGAGFERFSLRIPDSLSGRYEMAHALSTRGAEADAAILRDRRTGEEVFFKSYRGSIVPDEQALRQIQRDGGRFVSRIIDYSARPGQAWEMQEYYHFGSLEDWMRVHAGPVSDDDAREILSELTDALAHLHKMGIAHRDLKPANILLRSDSPIELVLTDFGLARANQEVTHATTGVKGTWQYAAPEIYDGKSTMGSDWFSLGSIMYELITGFKLFSNPDGSEMPPNRIMYTCLSGNYPTNKVENPRWRMLIEGLLVKDYHRRWGSLQIEKWLAGESLEALESSETLKAFSYAPKWCDRLAKTPQDFVRLMCEHWDDAASAFAGVPDEGLVAFLDSNGFEEAARLVLSGGSPVKIMIGLQRIIASNEPPLFKEFPLTTESLREQLKRANSGSEDACKWLFEVVKTNALSAYAETYGDERALRIGRHLSRWKKQSDDVAALAPRQYRHVATDAFMRALPELFMRAFDLEHSSGSSIDSSPQGSSTTFSGR